MGTFLARRADLPHATAMSRQRIIPDRAEFVDALRALRRGCVLVHVHDGPGGCVLDGGPVYWSFDVLRDYALIDEFDNPAGFPRVHYYRLSRQGLEFAQRALDTWRRRPLFERLAVRVAG